jgi:hypothetical protein
MLGSKMGKAQERCLAERYLAERCLAEKSAGAYPDLSARVNPVNPV